MSITKSRDYNHKVSITVLITSPWSMGVKKQFSCLSICSIAAAIYCKEVTVIVSSFEKFQVTHSTCLFSLKAGLTIEKIICSGVEREGGGNDIMSE